MQSFPVLPASMPLAALLALLAAPSAQADLLIGRVLLSNGSPAVNVNIDIDNKGSGGDPTITGDFTDVNGNFAIVVPAGLYDVIFNPPLPPVSTHLTKVVPDVAIAGTKDLGTLTLTAGFSLTGRCLGSTGLPLAGINLDVIDLATGENLLLLGDNTNAFGQFTVSVPQTAIEVQFDTTPVIGVPQAPKSLLLDLSANTNLGDIQFAAGFALTGRVVNSGGVGLANVDVDVVDANNVKLYTPKDNSNSLGNFSVIVPAGIYDVELCPPFSSAFAGLAVAAVNVAGATNLGNLTLPAGLVLSGTVTTHTGAQQTSGDVDLFNASSGLPVYVCYDNIKSDGTYALKVPAGTYKVQMEPLDFVAPLGSFVVNNYALFGNQVLNGVLPACPYPSGYGAGTPGTGGAVLQLGAVGGAPRVDNPGFAFVASNALGGTLGGIYIGFGQSFLPFAGGAILIDPFGPLVTFPLSFNGAFGVAGAGSASLPLTIKNNYAGVSIYCQAYAVDFGTPHFITLSNGLLTQFCQ